MEEGQGVCLDAAQPSWFHPQPGYSSKNLLMGVTPRSQ